MTAAVSLRCSLGDLAVNSGDLTERQWGPWTALLEAGVAKALPAGERVELVIRREDGAEAVYSGTVRHAGAVAGSESLWIYLVGGRGGLLAELPPVPYAPGTTEITVAIVAKRIAEDAGEALADGVEAELEGVRLARWHRVSGITGAAALDLLAEETGLVWRIGRSGKLWIGAETWPAPKLDAQALTYITEDIADGAVHYACDGAPIEVGQTIGALRAVEVGYSVSSSSLRVGVRGTLLGDPPHQADRELYARSWPASVVAARDDGTLDLRADDARIGDVLAVPFRVGAPGCKVEVSEGAHVRLRFEGASPAGAYACDIEQDEDAEDPLALVGDGCSYISGTVAAAPGPVMLVVSSTPTGAPGEVRVMIVGPGHKYVKGRRA